MIFIKMIKTNIKCKICYDKGQTIKWYCSCKSGIRKQKRDIEKKSKIKDKIPTSWTLKKKLIKIFNAYIRKRDNYTCVICWSKLNPNCWHYLSCISNATRFDERNCNCQCAKCNKSHEYNFLPYHNWMLKRYWQEIIDELNKLWNSTRKFTQQEYLDMIEYYSKLL